MDLIDELRTFLDRKEPQSHGKKGFNCALPPIHRCFGCVEEQVGQIKALVQPEKKDQETKSDCLVEKDTGLDMLAGIDGWLFVHGSDHIRE